MTTPTPIRWNALTPRARDALVAIHIFGDAPRCLHEQIRALGGSLRQCSDCGEQFGDTSLLVAWSWPAPFTQSIPEAFSVVEKMREKGFEVVMDAAEVGNWVCVFFRSDDRDTIVEVEAANLPEAITIGSLQAHGFEVERE
jgi:hypothetical protein